MDGTQNDSGSPAPRTAVNAAPPAQSFRGVLLFMLGMLLFACMDSSTKYLVAYYEVPLVMAIRYFVNCLLMVILLAPSQGRALVGTQRTGWVLVRAACLAAASLFMGLALQRMPIGETTAIVFLSPLLVVLIAGPVLGERVGVIGWVAAIGGFAGILLIANPGAGLDTMGTVFALCAAGVTAIYQLLSRVLASTEQTVPMLFYTTVVGSIAFGVFLPWSWGGAVPTPVQTLLFLGIGVLGGLGHYLFTAAYRSAPASVLAPMMYVQLLWASLLGWSLFGHVPAASTVAGMCIIAACGALVALKSRITRKAMAEPME